MAATMTIVRTIIYLVLYFQISLAAPVITQRKTLTGPGCVTFEAPRNGAIIKGATCTLSIAACTDVESIHLSACFPPGGGMTDTILDLGTISQPPFKLIWNISDIPNQLFRGMWFLADAAYKNGGHQLLSHDGVFLYTKPISNSLSIPPLSTDQQKLFYADTLHLAGGTAILTVLGSWNVQGLHFTTLVVDQAFTMAMPSDKLAELGAIVGIEPSLTKSAYPLETSLIFSFPLMSKPVQYIYKKREDPGHGMHFSIDTIPYPYPATVKTAEGKGYGLEINIPKAVFKGEMPESISCNILMKVADRNKQIHSISLNHAAGHEALCPLLWVRLQRKQSGLFDNTLYAFLLCFGGGFIITFLFGYFIWPKRTKTFLFKKLDLSEEEKQLAKTIYAHLERNITKNELALSEVSRELSISGSKIESVIKKYNGLPFKRYIMQARVEIAMERLRSSHASETSIAESCGFKTINEMEKSFGKYCRTTPYKYRRDNQVA
jgi:AraC-like DNA-binding protein